MRLILVILLIILIFGGGFGGYHAGVWRDGSSYGWPMGGLGAVLIVILVLALLGVL